MSVLQSNVVCKVFFRSVEVGRRWCFADELRGPTLGTLLGAGLARGSQKHVNHTAIIDGGRDGLDTFA